MERRPSLGKYQSPIQGSMTSHHTLLGHHYDILLNGMQASVDWHMKLSTIPILLFEAIQQIWTVQKDCSMYSEVIYIFINCTCKRRLTPTTSAFRQYLDFDHMSLNGESSRVCAHLVHVVVSFLSGIVQGHKLLQRPWLTILMISNSFLSQRKL